MIARIGQATRLPSHRFDSAFVISAVLILGIGLVMVASSSVAVADRLMEAPLHYFYRQAVYAVLGIVAGFVALHIPMRIWQANSFGLLGVALVLLVLVLIPGIGDAANGARRWIDLGVFNVQASEPARLLLLLYVAAYAVRQHVELRTTFGGLMRPMMPLALACLLLILEPNFGACLILFAVCGVLLFLAGARLLHLSILGSGGGLMMALVAFAEPYRVARLASFTNPWADPYNTGYQLIQSLIAIGRGEIFGVGLGRSIQKLFYLPDAHTDFLFAVLAEEFGLLGSLTVIALFTILVWRGFVIAQRALASEQYFGAYVVYGIITWIVLQAFINIGVNLGALPTKGLPLPLMSYGGSAIVTAIVALALVLRVDLESRVPSDSSGTHKGARR